MNKILVTGGCGYIGVHTIVDLVQNGYEVISVDNNSRSSAAILEGAEQIIGKKIKNYIYSKEAEFKGGGRAWNNYIAKNVNTEFKSKGREEEIVKVRILFAVNETGNTANIKVIESSGNKQVDNDAIRVIQASPVWNNALYLNKPVKVYRIQPISYVLSPNQKN